MPLIVFEGIDGCGKSTQMELLVQRFAAEGRACHTWREPGSTLIGERVRDILLDPQTQACPRAELFGYLLARAQLVHDKIAPSLAAGELVVLDRFYYSTIAYQAHALNLNYADVRAAISIALNGITVDKAFWLKLDPQVSIERRADRAADRIEARGLSYLQEVDAGYALQVNTEGLIVLDATDSREAIAERIWEECSF